MIPTLPPELLHQIFQKLQMSDLKRLRSTCKRFNAVATPFVFSSMKIDTDSSQFRKYSSILKAIASGRSDVARHVQTLTILSLTPPRYKRLKLWQRIMKRKQRVYRAFENDFLRAITKFEAVTSLYFDIHTNQPSSADKIMQSLGALPRLSKLSVHMYHDVDPSVSLSLSRHFKNLSSIHLCGLRLCYNDAPSIIIANSPELTELTLDGTSELKSDKAATMENLFSKLPTGTTLPLQSLTIGGTMRYLLDPAPQIPPHFKSLTSLVITSDTISVPADFWRALETARIYLQKLSVRELDEPLLSYLESYAGLKDLSAGRFDDDVAKSDLAADRFYHCVVPKHSGSLRNVRVNTDFEGKWCLGDTQLDEIMRCSGLVSLDVSVGLGEVDAPYDENVITRLLEGVASGVFPLLRYIAVSFANPRSVRSIADPIILMYAPHGVHGHRRINDIVSEFQCVKPNSCMLALEMSTGHMHNSRLVKSEADFWSFKLMARDGSYYEFPY
ncbi:uncharacterized protein BT62DRAFT_933639 [Guyanagaster necrorhizus]|uniref:F-box domain-containing protein n=1 Tax=Guyanagaster necrorhizus TaxID=856835 RepID=A0A9P7VQ42_9AGAR|nr:uncharacterized protein BT62DRAFT_933639 [Guyanagaster necrorhizus MCA 3950]KAG7444608.1 hypothetical protein BT62DRAFT_933639 [Guyanagaster necrorhizus MCA 3950]